MGVFTYEQYDAKSPWADKRVRLAANHAINRQAINEAETLGYSVLTGSIVPRAFEYALPLEPYAYDPQKAKQLLKEAGYQNGFDMGEYSVDPVYAGVAEAIVNDLFSVGIRGKVRPMERATFQTAHKEHTPEKPGPPGQWRVWECGHASRGVCLQQGGELVDQRR